MEKNNVPLFTSLPRDCTGTMYVCGQRIKYLRVHPYMVYPRVSWIRTAISDASNSFDSVSMRPSDVVSPCLRSGPTDCSRARFGSPSATRWVRAVRYICRVRIAGCDQPTVAYYQHVSSRNVRGSLRRPYRLVAHLSGRDHHRPDAPDRPRHLPIRLVRHHDVTSLRFRRQVFYRTTFG